MLGTSVRTLAGKKLTFGEALSREGSVWARLGLGLLTIFALLFSCRRLARDGVTSWDEFGGFVVRHGKIGAARGLLAAIVIVGSYAWAFNAVRLELARAAAQWQSRRDAR